MRDPDPHSVHKFNLQNELNKLKISMHLAKVVRLPTYK